ncbi:MAG TPA: NAD-binding protein, partial [Chloroflexota bacterium]|nr:NAD-binding protein [Chloroflexota bacterium]
MGVISRGWPRFWYARSPETSGPQTVSQTSVNPPAVNDPATPLAIVVGAGETGCHLATRLGRNWRVHLLDLNPMPSWTAQTEPGQPSPIVELLKGDGTSRLVLERAGAGEAAALIAATGDDRVNLECARLAHDVFGVKRVLVLFRDSAIRTEIEACGAEPIDAASAVASLLLGHLDPTIRPAVGVGLGQGEIVEVTVLGSSPVIGRPLRLLGARDWLVAAIYRQDHLLVPHGDTVLENGDRVVLVGAPSVLPDIAEYFRAGTFGFPMPFGRRLGVVVTDDPPDGFWEEVGYLYHQTTAAGVDVFAVSGISPIEGYSWHSIADGSPLDLALSYPGIGCVILPSNERQIRFPLGRPSLLWEA